MKSKRVEHKQWSFTCISSEVLSKQSPSTCLIKWTTKKILSFVDKNLIQDFNDYNTRESE